MGQTSGPKCKKCRREGEKLFLRGERCFSQKCAMVKRNYPPGVHGPKGKSRQTPYGLQLREKQKAKRLYGLMEKQFRNYYQKAMKRKGDTGEFFLQLLELRFDNVLYRLGFAKSRKMARQMIGHKHFLINGKKCNIPSCQLKINDAISVREKSLSKESFKDLAAKLQKQETPGWLIFDPKELTAKVASLPKSEDLKQNINIKAIVEFYSR